MTIEEQIGERLNQFLFENDLSQTALSQAIDVKQSYISQIIRGKKGMSAKVIINITSAFKNLNVRWLLTGEGEMYNLPNYYPPPELESGIPDKLEEGVRIEYARPEEQLEAMQRQIYDHEHRIRDLEGRD